MICGLVAESEMHCPIPPDRIRHYPEIPPILPSITRAAEAMSHPTRSDICDATDRFTRRCSNNGQLSRRAPSALDHVREPPEALSRAKERALGEFRVEGQVVRRHGSLEERPAAVEEHVAEVSSRIAEFVEALALVFRSRPVT
jgi:hypothetical protein